MPSLGYDPRARARENIERPTACRHCTDQVTPPDDPVTVSGWYGPYLLTWRYGRLQLDDCACSACKDGLAAADALAEAEHEVDLDLAMGGGVR